MRKILTQSTGRIATRVAWLLCSGLLLIKTPLLASETAAQCEPPPSVATALHWAQSQDSQHSVPPDLRINGANVESLLTSVVLQPGAHLAIDYFPRNLNSTLTIIPSSGTVKALSTTRWQYTTTATPALREKGLRNKPAPLATIGLCAGNFQSLIRVWSAHPWQQLPPLVQAYPAATSAPNPPEYRPPDGLLLVANPELAAAAVSPHFRLSQFLPKAPMPGQKVSWPQYTLLSLRLLEKLELVVNVLRSHNKPVSTLTILSAYRTPDHNRRVGGATYSRHQYGDAVDFIVDADGDGKMDDLNGDGVIGVDDLNWLTDRLARRSVPVTPGGIGQYETHGHAQAFLHLDARGATHYW